MLLRTHDTIVAIASAPGGAVRGIVRVSGPQAVSQAHGWFRETGAPKLADVRQPTAVAGDAILNERGEQMLRLCIDACR
mgnify:CR=1 FL=1